MPGLLEGQVDAGPVNVEHRRMAFSDLRFDGNTVTGRIIDAATGQPSAGANVIAASMDVGAATHADGSFAIHADTPIQQITASFVGYEPMKAQQ